MEKETYDDLHIYGQKDWHDEAIIVGNRQALEKLKQLIELALEKGDGMHHFWPNDRECYELYVSCQDDQTMEKLTVPYTEAAFASKNNAVEPYDVLGEKVPKLWPYLEMKQRESK